MHRARLLAAIAALALALPSTAFGWDTFRIWLSSSTTSPNGCWYQPGAVCSGWNYFTFHTFNKYESNGGTVLYGYENNNVIRGRFSSAAGTYYIYPSDVSMGGYLKAQSTWWGDPASDIRSIAGTG